MVTFSWPNLHNTAAVQKTAGSVPARTQKMISRQIPGQPDK